MASSRGIIRQYGEYIQPIDFGVMAQVLMQKQQQYDQNYYRVQSAIDNIANLDILKDVDAQYLNNRLQQVVGAINSVGQLDLSDIAVTSSLSTGISNVVDKNVINAVAGTQRARKEQAYIDDIKKNNPGKYNYANHMAYLDKFDEWYSNPNVGVAYKGAEYVPYVNVQKELHDQYNKVRATFKVSREQTTVHPSNPNYFLTTKEEYVPREVVERFARGVLSQHTKQLEIDAKYSVLPNFSGEAMVDHYKERLAKTEEERATLRNELEKHGKNSDIYKQNQSLLDVYDQSVGELEQRLEAVQNGVASGTFNTDAERTNYYMNSVLDDFVQTNARKTLVSNKISANTIPIQLERLNIEKEKLRLSRLKMENDLEIAKLRAASRVSGRTTSGRGGEDGYTLVPSSKPDNTKWQDKIEEMGLKSKKPFEATVELREKSLSEVEKMIPQMMNGVFEDMSDEEFERRFGVTRGVLLNEGDTPKERAERKVAIHSFVKNALEGQASLFGDNSQFVVAARNYLDAYASTERLIDRNMKSIDAAVTGVLENIIRRDNPNNKMWDEFLLPITRLKDGTLFTGGTYLNTFGSLEATQEEVAELLEDTFHKKYLKAFIAMQKAKINEGSSTFAGGPVHIDESEALYNYAARKLSGKDLPYIERDWSKKPYGEFKAAWDITKQAFGALVDKRNKIDTSIYGSGLDTVRRYFREEDADFGMMEAITGYYKAKKGAYYTNLFEFLRQEFSGTWLRDRDESLMHLRGRDFTTGGEAALATSDVVQRNLDSFERNDFMAALNLENSKYEISLPELDKGSSDLKRYIDSQLQGRNVGGTKVAPVVDMKTSLTLRTDEDTGGFELLVPTKSSGNTVVKYPISVPVEDAYELFGVELTDKLSRVNSAPLHLRAKGYNRNILSSRVHFSDASTPEAIPSKRGNIAQLTRFKMEDILKKRFEVENIQVDTYLEQAIKEFTQSPITGLLREEHMGGNISDPGNSQMYFEVLVNDEAIYRRPFEDPAIPVEYENIIRQFDNYFPHLLNDSPMIETNLLHYIQARRKQLEEQAKQQQNDNQANAN